MHIEIYDGADYNWYWRFRNKGRITADAEAFVSRGNAVRAAKAVVVGTVREIGMTVTFSKPMWDAKRECFLITWS